MTRRGARDDEPGRSSVPQIAAAPPIVTLDCAAARRVDQEATHRYGIPSILLMENAARAVADLVGELAESTRSTRCIIVCGPGNNGGDGYAAARHLHNRGMDVVLIPVGDARPGGDAAVNREICARMELPTTTIDSADLPRAGAIVVDALLGTGLDRPPEGAVREAIEAIVRWREAGAKVVSVDVPSGLDSDRGEALAPTIVADATVTFVAPKPGLLDPRAAGHVGRLVVGDIGVPRELVAKHATGLQRRLGEDAHDGRVTQQRRL